MTKQDLLNRAKDRYDQTVDAIERAFALLDDGPPPRERPVRRHRPAMGETRAAVLAAVKAQSPIVRADLAKATGMDGQSLSYALSNLMAAGQIRRQAYGVYSLAPAPAVLPSPSA